MTLKHSFYKNFNSCPKGHIGKLSVYIDSDKFVDPNTPVKLLVTLWIVYETEFDTKNISPKLNSLDGPKLRNIKHVRDGSQQMLSAYVAKFRCWYDLFKRKFLIDYWEVKFADSKKVANKISELIARKLRRG